MNALLGEKLSIISPKAQTTRHKLVGIINTPEYQLVCCDTPGYVSKPAYKLHHAMNSYVKQSFQEADMLCLVTDRYQKEEEQQYIIDQLAHAALPTVIVYNKADRYTETHIAEASQRWQVLLPKATFIAISALTGLHIDSLMQHIVSHIPESPAYYDKDTLTDRQMRYFATEMVREKIFMNYSEEIPYSCQVVCDEYKESPDMDRIRCTIYVERESQKNIVIGKGGSALTKVGTEARISLEEFLGKKVFLGLFVKVKEGWRDSDNALRAFGYDSAE
jgi:GTPase